MNTEQSWSYPTHKNYYSFKNIFSYNSDGSTLITYLVDSWKNNFLSPNFICRLAEKIFEAFCFWSDNVSIRLSTSGVYIIC